MAGIVRSTACLLAVRRVAALHRVVLCLAVVDFRHESEREARADLPPARPLERKFKG